MKDRLPPRFGPYEILGPLGSGGMGEVYRARDTRLHRDVAVKILPQSAASNPDRHRRFTQEAIAVGALNHPNIVAIYDVGVEGDTAYLVSELVDGTSLREEMLRGRMPVKRLLDVGAQIADGLAAAHGAGIVHRDLKPENVMLTREGRVKVLDFGLAKMIGGEDEGTVPASALTQTADGLIVGTVPYMSPEQARGAHVDFRSDQFSLGVMLIEMATGAHPFKRDSAVQTLSAIISDEAPDLAQATPPLPVPLRWGVERLLAKNPRDRYAHTDDLVADLRLIRDRLSEALLTSSAPSHAPARRRLLPWAVGAALAIAAFSLGRAVVPVGLDLTTYRFTPLATDAGFQGAPAFSPDGKSIAYVAEVDGVLQIFTRSLASSMRSQVTRSRFDCHDPFWAPDGNRIYYHSLARDSEALWQISLAGGAPEKLIDGTLRAAISPDGRTLALMRSEVPSGRLRLWVSAPAGAEPTRYARGPLGQLEFDDGQLRFSPDGSTLLMWLLRDVPDSRGQAQQTGFWSMAMPDGMPRLILPSLAGPRAIPFFSWLPDSRHIVMARSDGRTPGAHLWMVDTRNDVAQPLTVTNGNEGSPSVAPDGRQIALTSESTDFDLVWVPSDGSAIQTTLSSTRNEMDPAWSPIRAEYAYVTDRSGPPEIWLRSEDGHTNRPLVTDAETFDGSRTIAMGSLAFSPDGQRLAYQRFGTGGYRIWISPIAGGNPVQLTSGGYEDAPSWSPDGEWIAFMNGQRLAKVRVGSGAMAPVTLLQSDSPLFERPRWSPDNHWILHQTPDGLMLIAPDGKDKRLLSADAWLAYEWAADSATVYGLQATDDLHHFMLVSVDVKTGRQRVLNGNLGMIPQANQPIRGFTRAKTGAFLSSIARVRSDIWLLDGFRTPAGALARLWPFGTQSTSRR